MMSGTRRRSRSRPPTWSVLVVLWLGLAGSVWASVDLTLYNAEPLLREDGLTPLAGTASHGSLVQVILAGNNTLPDEPQPTSGGPGGDDVLLFTTHVGVGLPLTDAGLLVQSSILYDNAWIGTNAYVRFWNAETVAGASYYGDSGLFALPAGDIFSLAELDFVPLSSSPRITDTPFNLEVIPEPSALLWVGLAILLWVKRRAWWALVSLLAVMLTGPVQAQDLWRLDVTARVGIRGADGQWLPGRNPDVTGDTTGCLVQILDAGSNGVADLPALDGSPGGDDVVLTTTVVGKGMAPNVSLSGRFASAVYPPPAVGRRLFARVFNAPTVAAATRWGQSASFVVDGVTVMDVSALGLGATTQIVGVNPQVVDTDGDGRTDYEELVANTNPADGQDVLAGGPWEIPAGLAGLTIAGRPGREYVLQRSADMIHWEDVGPTVAVTTATTLWLQDPNPPASSQMFYRVRVRMP
jgi:hypothetical protein